MTTANARRGWVSLRRISLDTAASNAAPMTAVIASGCAFFDAGFATLS
jgi:hypothetical protein